MQYVRADVKVQTPGCVCGGWGTLIYSYILRRLGPYFWLKILNFNLFGVFSKINVFGVMKILWIFCGGQHKIGLVLGVMCLLRTYATKYFECWNLFNTLHTVCLMHGLSNYEIKTKCHRA